MKEVRSFPSIELAMQEYLFNVMFNTLLQVKVKKEMFSKYQEENTLIDTNTC